MRSGFGPRRCTAATSPLASGASWRAVATAGRHSASAAIAQNSPQSRISPPARPQRRRRPRRDHARAGAGFRAAGTVRRRLSLMDLGERATVMSNKMWGGRFAVKPPTPSWRRSMFRSTVDRQLYPPGYSRVSKAHAAMLANRRASSRRTMQSKHRSRSGHDLVGDRKRHLHASSARSKTST